MIATSEHFFAVFEFPIINVLIVLKYVKALEVFLCC
jgi:hypothetical protein